jgi:DNA-binding PadR family transcriptional regulator
MKPDNLDAALEEMVRAGHLEVAGEKNGERTYRMTDKGRAYAEQLLHNMGVDPNDGDAVRDTIARLVME